jgi:hypothetical protein
MISDTADEALFSEYLQERRALLFASTTISFRPFEPKSTLLAAGVTRR